MLVCVSRSVIKRFFALIHDLCIQCSLRCRIRHSRRHREQTRCPLAQKSRKRVRVAPAAVCVDVSRRHWQQQLRLPQPPRRGAGNVEQPAAGDPFLLSGGRAYFQCVCRLCVPSVCAVCVCCVFCIWQLIQLDKLRWDHFPLSLPFPCSASSRSAGIHGRYTICSVSIIEIRVQRHHTHTHTHVCGERNGNTYM